ncbi:MAG TPA: tetratricopeptide repeat protein [Candidatus Methanoperedens sp.]|nr:tetratricopeptide repeat protein [Candidatus Methanoperedens sp.]
MGEGINGEQRGRHGATPGSRGAARRPPAALVAVLLLLSSLALFWRIGGHEFLNYDDNIYLTENKNVREGLTARSLAWAFSSHDANWHPLTWISHLIDVELFGLQPRGHHLHNVLLHAVNGALLFLALRSLTGALWPPALVAALFAVHPLHVESVVWAAERKDLLAGLFWMLALLAYARYARVPSRGRYLSLLAACALGLMAKPMLVSLPAILLLLDFWPLARLGPPARGRVSWRRVVLEKVPLIALAGASSVVAIIAQRTANAMAYSQEYPLGARVANALTAYWAYLGQAVWPAGLTFYPFEGWRIPLWQSAGAGVLLATVTAALVVLALRRGWALVGWLWFLVSLVPVIGLVQVGVQARADRYTYLPLTGIFLVCAWALRELVRRWSRLRPPVAAACVAALVALAARTWIQAGYWRSDTELFGRAVAVRPDNWIAINNLGNALLRAGRMQEGQAAISRAYKLNPYLRFDLLIRTGDVYAGEGRLEEALATYRKAQELIPYDRVAPVKIAEIRRRLGR